MKKLINILLVIWVLMRFHTMDNLTTFLNGLSYEQAKQAKITSYTGHGIGMYFLIYPEELDND